MWQKSTLILQIFTGTYLKIITAKQVENVEAANRGQATKTVGFFELEE